MIWKERLVFSKHNHELQPLYIFNEATRTLGQSYDLYDGSLVRLFLKENLRAIKRGPFLIHFKTPSKYLFSLSVAFEIMYFWYKYTFTVALGIIYSYTPIFCQYTPRTKSKRDISIKEVFCNEKEIKLMAKLCYIDVVFKIL